MLRRLPRIQPRLKRLRNDPERQWRAPFGRQRKRLPKPRPSPFSGGFRRLAALRRCVRLASSLIDAIPGDERWLGSVLQTIMIRRLQLWRMLGALAVLAALWLAPQAARAHPGHSHAHPAAVAAVTQQAVAGARETAVQVEQKLVTQELTEADPAAPCADLGCGDRGCCSNGPCTGCHGFVVVPVPATTPPTLSSIVRPEDPPPHLGAGGTKLKRPPKSFV